MTHQQDVDLDMLRTRDLRRALIALEGYLRNTPHHNAPEAAAARKVVAATAGDVGRIGHLERLVAAYRLAAVNEGWVHRFVDAYGYKEYTGIRIDAVDAIAQRTIASGYDAAGYLRDHTRPSKDLPT